MDKQKEDGNASLVKLRRQFQSYVSAKAGEIEEATLSYRYYSGVQFTSAQSKALAKRKQPGIVFNATARKIDGVVGTVRKLRTTPKAYPRTESQEEAAELATQVVRYVCDASGFEKIEGQCLLQSAIFGIAFAEMTITGEAGNPDIKLVEGDSRTFFYDPRSVKPDFSDARFMGTYRWAAVEEIEEIAPGMSDKIGQSEDGTFTTTAELDLEHNWVDEQRRVKLVDHWYIEGGRWRWCLHAGTAIIAQGESPFSDDDGKPMCKYIAFSSYIDHEGDRYGFGRNLKGPQDAMNQHRSKAIWIMNARQVVARRGSLADIEKTRAEMMKPDGIVEYDGDPNDFRIEQPNQEFLQQTQYYQDAKDQIENFGPNPALMGTGVNARSGRAYSMMQQSGLAEIGPFLGNYRQWKLSLYKAVWGAVKAHWKAERWLRVTGDEKVAQFVKVNEMRIGPDGFPIIVNQLGAIDVDIVMDEGPDTENVMGDVFDTLQAMSQSGAAVPAEVLIEMSPLPGSVKEKLIKLMQPPPVNQQAEQIKLAQEAAKAEETKAKTYKTTTDAWINEQQLGMNPAAHMQGIMPHGMPIPTATHPGEMGEGPDNEAMPQDMHDFQQMQPEQAPAF